MLNIHYNYNAEALVSGPTGAVVIPQFEFPDYKECRVTVYREKREALDLSQAVSWRGAIDTDTDTATQPLIRILPEDFDLSAASSGVLGFAVNCNYVNFRDRITAKTAGTLVLYGEDESGRQIHRISIPVYLAPPIDPPGDADPLEVPEGAVYSINTLRGHVEFYDADGNLLVAVGNKMHLPKVAGPPGLPGGPGPVGPRGLTIVADPVTELPVYDSVWGYCRYLDSTYTRLAFPARLRNLVRVRLEVVSANPELTGTVVLVPVVNGVDRDPVTINVGATPAEVVIDLAITSGTLAIKRIGGTLADGGGMITCIVTVLVLEVQYA